MSALAATNGMPVPALRLSVERLRCLMLWLMGFAGAFVFVEPSPYEVVGLATIAVFALAGLAFQRAIVPLLLLLVLLDIGYATAMLQVYEQPKPVIWVLVSIFLAATAMFYAAMLGSNTEARLKWLLRGYLFAAVLASLLAMAGYFRLLGSNSSLFVLYERARGTFNDPNVLGAFLVLPGLLVFQRLLAGRLSAVIGNGALLLLMLAALLLSFSRAAWAQFAFGAVVVMGLTFATTRSPNERVRIVLIAIAGAGLIAVFVAALLSMGDVAKLFEQRATLDQSYDAGHYGRFGRYILGAELALERPFGLGPLQFARFFTEDPHNTFLNAFMSGGWLAGFAYLTLTLVTIATGLRFILTATPWRSAYQAVYAAFLGVAAESAIIDVDHWRHSFLLLGVLWGLMAASRAHLTSAARRMAPPAAADRVPALVRAVNPRT
jgi:O-antigen ligase